MQKELLAKVNTAVIAVVERDYPGKYVIEDHPHKDVAICVDFNESELTPKTFGKAVETCGEAAYLVVEGALTK